MKFSKSALIIGQLIPKLAPHLLEGEIVSFGVEIAAEFLKDRLKLVQSLLHSGFAHSERHYRTKERRDGLPVRICFVGFTQVRPASLQFLFVAVPFGAPLPSTGMNVKRIS
jgi:hypothetical protein